MYFLILIISGTDCVFFFCVFAGVQSGFVTLPRLSRLERQFQDGDVLKGSPPDNSGITLTRSDSLASFIVDLGPSLMTEVLSLIDNASSLQISKVSLKHNGNYTCIASNDAATVSTERQLTVTGKNRMHAERLKICKGYSQKG